MYWGAVGCDGCVTYMSLGHPPGGGTNCRFDCDDYRPDTLGGGGKIYSQKLTRKGFSFDLSPHLVIFFLSSIKE